MLGIHIANKGEITWFEETTFNTSNEKMNAKAMAIPMARFSPIPPRFFCEDRERARKVRMNIDTGMDVLWWSSFRYMFRFLLPRIFSLSINFISSGVFLLSA